MFLRDLFNIREWPAFFRLWLGIVGILVVVLGSLGYLTVRVLPNRLIAQIHEQIGDLAMAEMDQVVILLDEQMRILETVTANEAFVSACAAANERYASDVAAQLQAAEAQWLTAEDDSAVVRAVVDPELNALSAQLQQHVERMPQFDRMLITDRYGGLLAATERPLHYDYSDADWWQTAYAEGQGGVFVGLLTASETVLQDGVLPLSVAVPVRATGGEVVGVVRGTLSGAFASHLRGSWVETYNLWHVSLVTGEGQVIASTDPALRESEVPDSWIGPAYRVNRSSHAHEATREDGTPVLLGHVSFPYIDLTNRMEFLESRDWILFIARPLRSAYQPVRVTRGSGLVLTVLFFLLGSGGGLFLTQRITAPLRHLSESTLRIASGDYAARVWEFPTGEYRDISQVFNMLLNEREELLTTIEESESVRAREQARRERDLEVSAAVGRVVAATSDTQALSRHVVELLREEFGLYYVGLYLLDEGRRWAVLYAGTGEAGKNLLARGYRISVSVGAVGWAITNGEARVLNDIDPEEREEIPPELPYSRAEAVMPLRSRGRVLGTLVLHSYHTGAFDEEGILVLQTIADQIAVAIDSIRLFAERQEAMDRLQEVYGEATRAAWGELLETRFPQGSGYRAELLGVEQVASSSPSEWSPEARRAWEHGVPVYGEAGDGEGGQVPLALPIKSRDEVIGVIDVDKRSDAGAWTEEEVRQLQELIQQLAVTLESARLYEETQRSAASEQVVGEVTANIRALLDVDAILQTTVQDVRTKLGLAEAEIWMGGDGSSTDVDASETASDTVVPDEVAPDEDALDEGEE
jgi:GAF domain-containing protein/HAMP domain-containing protein